MRLATFAFVFGSAVGFQIVSPWSNRRNRVAPLFESSLEDDDAAADATTTTATAVVVEEPSSDLADLAKSDLLETAKSLKDEFGCVLIDSGAQEKLTKVVETLESTAEPPADTSGLIGDWTLLCSTASASIGSEDGGPIEKQTIAGIDTSKLPFFNEGPIKEIRDRLNKSVKVEQLIKASDTTIDRVDHVVEYMPPDTLSEFFDTLPDAIKSLNINPLQVSESKVILVHKAEIESVIPSIKTKLSLQSVVLNVAGKSQILEPDGADVLGINVPFGEQLNAGSFETTYLDEDLRVSRSKTGIVDQLRVFVRSSEAESPVMVEEDSEEEFFVDEDEEVDDSESTDDIAPSDVEGEAPTDMDDVADSDVEGDAPSDVE